VELEKIFLQVSFFFSYYLFSILKTIKDKIGGKGREGWRIPSQPKNIFHRKITHPLPNGITYQW
jgi:hypothetical protein